MVKARRTKFGLKAEQNCAHSPNLQNDKCQYYTEITNNKHALIHIFGKKNALVYQIEKG